MKKLVIAAFLLLSVGCSSLPSYVNQANKIGVEEIKEAYRQQDAALTDITYDRIEVKMKYYYYSSAQMLFVVYDVVIHYTRNEEKGRYDSMIELSFKIMQNGVVRY